MTQFVSFFFLSASVLLYAADCISATRRAHRLAIAMDRVING
jgi:hypothetical protein